MADKNDKKSPDTSPSSIKSLVQANRDARSNIYRKTMGSDDTIGKINQQTLTGLDDAVDFVTKQNARLTGGNDILQLLTRSAKKNNTEDIEAIKNIETLLSGDNTGIDHISKLYMMNRERLKIVNDIRMITYYMPELDEAISTYSDNILSPDDHTKDVFTIVTSNINNELTSDRLKSIRDKYKLNKKIKRIVHQTIKYGECFVYRESYADIFARMISMKVNSTQGKALVKESVGVILEHHDIKTPSGDKLAQFQTKLISLADSLVEYHENASSIGAREMIAVMEASNISPDISGTDDFAKIAKGAYAASIKGNNTSGYADGTISTKDAEKPDITGSVIKFLKPEAVLPVVINDYCIGYYYLETKESIEMVSRYREAGGLLSTNPGVDSVSKVGEQMERVIGDLIFKKLDKKFIEDNSNYKEAIYSFCQSNKVLSGEKTLRITFMEASKVHHFKIDEDDEGRGVSKLSKSIFPASLHTAISLSDTMQKLTRSYDKRAYFVKQGIDKNISRSLTNAVSQIKKSQFNLSNLSNMESLTQMVGRFNDYFIPVSMNGEKPIEFEVISGQDTNSDMDFLDKLQRKAVSVTGVPYALIEFKNEVDFAKSLAMANGAFVRNVISAQIDIQPELGEFITALVRAEYTDLASESFDIKLPIPSTLNMGNTAEQLNTSMDVVDKIIDTMLPASEDEAVKGKVKEKLMKQYNPNINWDMIEETIKLAKIEAKEPKVGDGDSSSTDDL